MVNGVAGRMGGWQMVSQKRRNWSTRLLGGLPAMMAAFSAPMEMPATQLGCSSASASP
jgi:hypothetical protein